MTPRSHKGPRWLARRFARADNGATAVEFALVSLPLLMLIFGMLELALVLLVVSTLDSAVMGAARQIRTGEFQTSAANTKDDFKALVCQRMSWLNGQCPTNLFLDVQTFSNFSGMAAAPAPDFTKTPPVTCFSDGQPGDIVLVRAYFEWHLFTPLLNTALENMGAGSGIRLISSTTAFRNEPYNTSPPIGAKC